MRLRASGLFTIRTLLTLWRLCVDEARLARALGLPDDAKVAIVLQYYSVDILDAGYALVTDRPPYLFFGDALSLQRVMNELAVGEQHRRPAVDDPVGELGAHCELGEQDLDHDQSPQ